MKFVASTAREESSGTEAEDHGSFVIRPVEGLGTIETAEVLVAIVLLTRQRSIGAI